MTNNQIKQIIAAAEDLIVRYRQLDYFMMKFKRYADYRNFLNNFVKDDKHCLLCTEAKIISQDSKEFCHACIYSINEDYTDFGSCVTDSDDGKNMATYRTIYVPYTNKTFNMSREVIKKAIKYRVRRIKKLIKQYREREKNENR